MSEAIVLHRPLSFLEELSEQRWDDHRYYHQSRVNQCLHLFSASTFLLTYALLFVDPVAAAFLGWVVAFWSRQIGHFFFEPQGYDAVNGATFEHKEEIKVGYNLDRKRALAAFWLGAPALLAVAPALDLRAPYRDVSEYLDQVGIVWLGLAGAGLLARTLWLCATRSVQTGLAWLTKILTDPFHDVRTYYRSPYYLFVKREWLDPMSHVRDEPPGAPSSHGA